MRLRILLVALVSCLLITDAAQAQWGRAGRWDGGWGIGEPYYGGYYGGYYRPGYYYDTPYYYGPAYYPAPETTYVQPSTGIIQASATMNAQTGMRITEVMDGGAAKKAALRPGDIVTAVGPTKTQTFQQLQDALAGANGEVELTYLCPNTMKLEKTKITPANGKIGVAVVSAYVPY